jgi:hypothetical protein
MGFRHRRTICGVTALACTAGAFAAAAHAAPSKLPLKGTTAKGGGIHAAYDAKARQAYDFVIDFGCAEVDGGRPTYTAVKKSRGRIASVKRDGTITGTIVTRYGYGSGGAFEGDPLGFATIKLSGKVKHAGRKVTGTGTVSVSTIECDSGTLKYSWTTG